MTIYTKNLTEELETIHRAVAELCGWGSIKKIDTADGFTVFRGRLNNQTYLSFVPDYIVSIDAIWKAFEDLGYQNFQIAECSYFSFNEKLNYEAFHVLKGLNDRKTSEVANTPSLALCKLLLTLHKNNG